MASFRDAAASELSAGTPRRGSPKVDCRDPSHLPAGAPAARLALLQRSGLIVAFIRSIPPSLADGRLAEVYAEIREEVPRVPNLMQVFSLRPETMERMYRSWLATMWTGEVSRQTKELMAVVVARVTRCDYCADAHMIFLQAAGMDREKCYAVERKLAEAGGLTARERAAVRFAERMTAEPRQLLPADRALLAHAWPDPVQRIEVIATIAALNCATRVANALGVALEIPAGVRQYEAARRGAINMLSRLAAVSTDWRTKSLYSDPPEVTEKCVAEVFERQLGFTKRPDGFEQLHLCPEVFDEQLRLIRKSVAVLPRDRWMRLGLVVGRLTGCDYLGLHCADWLERRGVDPSAVIAAAEGVPSSVPENEAVCLRFARDLTLHSHTMDGERIQQLRARGLSDGAVLDLAFAGGILNGLSRLVLGLAPF